MILERLRTTLATLNLTAIDARLDALLESASKQKLWRVGLNLRRPDHRHRDPRSPAASFDDGQHPRRKLPAGKNAARRVCCRLRSRGRLSRVAPLGARAKRNPAT